MELNNLQKGELVRRYKRFLADVEINGEVITAHCPNSGSMKSIAHPGSMVYLTKETNPKRKLGYTLQLIETENGIACINTNLANTLAYEAFRLKRFKGFNYNTVRKEVKYGGNSRIDIILQGDENIFVEVKNVTLEEEGLEGVAQFPDAKTERGRKHLRELSGEVEKGNRAIMFFLVNRTDCCGFKIAEHIDPDYKEEFDKAVEAGVEVMVYQSSIEIERNFARLEVDKKIET